ncbi:germ cell nuclear acidic protein-like [Dendropsophus ebraccatus]|uniref:germ cell nuclear acidic protein-like n=1 Tax=Dendropsophus ebraccatus TaxID=150705 RepID=UPI0038314EAE
MSQCGVKVKCSEICFWPHPLKIVGVSGVRILLFLFGYVKMPKRKLKFNNESDTDNSGTGDQLQVKRKCPKVVESNAVDKGCDEIVHQSYPFIPRSPCSGEESSVKDLPCRIVQETRRQGRPIKNCFLMDLTSEAKYVDNFKQSKQELTRRLYRFYNQTVFENQLPAEMSISWNKRLTKTTGRTGFRENNGDRYAVIQLSDKICDCAERLRDTIIHEMCHAACWILDGQADDLHGWLWKSYCEDAELIHPDLPPITEQNTYEIHYSVVYECSGCKKRLGRWRESVDIEKSMCGICHNKMVLLKST